MLQNLETVDLGLPSGTLWAKCNIGAEKETDCGKYFQWGDIEGRYADEVKDKPCKWHNAPFNNGLIACNKDYFNEHKHAFVNYDGILLPKYDAAFMNTHGLMRMPTKEQLEELRTYTIVTWEENFNGSGVKGLKCISLEDSSKYIFIPIYGYAYTSSLSSVGSYGYVWSSSFSTSNSPYRAWCLYIANGGMGVGYSARFVGHNIRGVISK